jgi:hypothetical protein
MLVFGPENWRHQKYWCIGTLVATAAAAVGYIVYGFISGHWSWPGGGSPPGFAFGAIGGLIILFEMLLWPRKALRGWRLGRTKIWMTAHIWLGLLTIPLLLMHGAFNFNVWTSTLAAILMWLLIVVVGSGVFGLALQNILPRRMLEELPAETIYGQIDHVLDEYRAEAARLVEITCGLSGTVGEGEGTQAVLAEAATAVPTLGSVQQIGRVQGKMVNVGAEIASVPGSDKLFTFYRQQIEPYLRAGSVKGVDLGSKAQASARFRALKTDLPKEAFTAVDRLADLCEQRRQFDVQRQMHFWLHSWLGAHVALSVALTLLMVVHAVLALKYP